MPVIDPRGNNEEKPEANCRSCTDFKTWAKIQRNKPDSPSGSHAGTTLTAVQGSINDEYFRRHDCPLDKDELGRSTWNLLHTMAATYPDKPTQQQSTDVKSFFSILSRTYPCEFCANDLQNDLKQEPIIASSQNEFAQWLCRLHNKVNTKLGKPMFDCSKVNERWRDGWKDGSCD